MHISEGVLHPAVLGAGIVLSAAGLGLGLKDLKDEKMVKTAIFSSAFFVASLIHLPIGPVSAHLVLNGLVGILLGWAAFCAIGVALFLQFVLFGFGGVTTLGINTFNIAAGALAVSYLFGPAIRRGNGRRSSAAAFGAGFVAILVSAVCLAVSLAVSGEAFAKTAQVVLAAHLPLAFIEGAVTFFVVRFLKKVKPEIFLN
ncbi:MAG: cobalt transporter CbiM [Candidatus Omnitrophica bacterium]|nr:cobalt transporter CbiM [Candidatus Omnitrophota bacterium]